MTFLESIWKFWTDLFSNGGGHTFSGGGSHRSGGGAH